MKTEYVSFTAKDGVVLQGLYFEPNVKTDRAIVHLHGLAGNFYENEFILEMAKAYASCGISFLSFNNRGHDYISDVAVIGNNEKEDFKGGGAYERFSECTLDLDAALKFIKQKGSSKICVQGHSSGCNKAVFALANQPKSQVVCLALLSPCDDIGIMEFYLKDKVGEGLAQARKFIAEDKGEQFIDEDKTFYPMCARTYLDYYENGSDQDVFPYRLPSASFDAFASLELPIMVTFGTDGEYITDSADATFEILKQKSAKPELLLTKVIQGAPHNYSGKEQELVSALTSWLETTL